MCCFIDPYIILGNLIFEIPCPIVKSQRECNVSFMLVLSSEQVCVYVCVCACVKVLCVAKE